jgi:hypothetical protein
VVVHETGCCEFDYSGTQACKALRSLGYKIVLVNSNPATIMTDPGIADATRKLKIDFTEACKNCFACNGGEVRSSIHFLLIKFKFSKQGDGKFYLTEMFVAEKDIDLLEGVLVYGYLLNRLATKTLLIESFL